VCLLGAAAQGGVGGADLDIVAVWINCPDGAVADAIGEALLARRLAASVNRYPPVASRYHWQGRLEAASEVPLVAKTRASLFGAVADVARALHPYRVPGIVAVEIVAATADYRDWVVAETRAPDGDGAE
jgi:periplasmic divalent cation tolerance protein